MSEISNESRYMVYALIVELLFVFFFFLLLSVNPCDL